MFKISYWLLPIISGVVWLGMLLGMLIHWTVNTHYRHYPSMVANQSIAYISDIGAGELKPLFITGCCVTTVFLDLSFGADRWLRHKGHLLPNVTVVEKVLSGLTIICAVAGTVGLILLSTFDTEHHHRLHDIFLALFIAGYIVSAVFLCAEYQRLGIKYRDHHMIRISFWIKLFFIVIEVVLAIAFGVCNRQGRYNAAAILEWAIAFVFTFYLLAFVIDLWPAVTNRQSGGYKTSRIYQPQNTESPAVTREMEDGGSNRGLTGHGGWARYAQQGTPSNF